jgi:hypothetical protein
LGTAAKLAIVPEPDDLSPAEILASCSGTELLAAATEDSKIYNGKVIAQAFLIVQCRLRCRSPYEMAKRLGMGKSTANRYINGHPVSGTLLNRMIRELAFLLAENQ